ncbi:MAG: helix-turn-helix transcriptional regulator [Planctomycetes bacterium]|nr:helix-turn-helix transcriptional regulator [Planctomycetota bacterium]
MDKPIAIYDEKRRQYIHKLYPELQDEVHRQYGLWIYRGGESTSVPGNSDLRRSFEFYAISHLLEGKGVYVNAEGRQSIFHPGQGVLVGPEYTHFYGGYLENYREDTICFSGPLADGLLRCGVISYGLLDIGLNRRLHPIIQLSKDPNPDCQIQANIQLQHLLVELYLENKEQKRNSSIQTLLRDLHQSPERWWTVEEMAKASHLSTVQFRRRFKEEMGLSPKQYIDKYKIQKAAGLLLKSRQSIASVAKTFSYRDAFHFSRRFKDVMGCSPKEYRHGIHGQ